MHQSKEYVSVAVIPPCQFFLANCKSSKILRSRLFVSHEVGNVEMLNQERFPPGAIQHFNHGQNNVEGTNICVCMYC